MAEKSLEARVKALENEVRSLTSGSNNPHILLSLRGSVVELKDKQDQIIRALKQVIKEVRALKAATKSPTP